MVTSGEGSTPYVHGLCPDSQKKKVWRNSFNTKSISNRRVRSTEVACPFLYLGGFTNSILAPNHGGGQVSDTADGAKKLSVRTGHHWNLATVNTRTLSSEGSLAVLLEELSVIN